MSATEQMGLFRVAPRSGTSPLLSHVRTHARNVPGVYRMRSVDGAVLYVGRSRTLRTRLLSYFRSTSPDEKAARLLQQTARIEWDELPSEFDAVVRECRLVRAHLPPFNRDMARPAMRYWMVVVAIQDDVPRLRLVRATQLVPTRHGRAVGPFTNARLVRDAIRVLNDALGLRDCPDDGAFGFADDDDLFGGDESVPSLRTATPRCHRFETRRCLGPCVAAAPRAAYGHAVDLALAYLAGTSDQPVAALQEALAAASAALAFERAGWLRSRLSTLAALDVQLARARAELGGPTGYYVVTGAPGEDRLVALRDGLTLGEARLADSSAIAALHGEVVRTAGGARMLLRPDRFEEMLTVTRWFASRPQELARVKDTIEAACAVVRGRSPERATSA
ncbi:MAG: GIY-YIG nuclease family protein [Burkholderiales bacterium]|jgi:excinuclease ABC subunit C|nr:GIY-YIG nuclease family protein [Gemmatimonadaceae bacterium]MCU0870162.1 GIY-YIG nuclease family protein [Burkholderiales bacterium]